MTDIAVFSYSNNDVRTVLIKQEPWFVASDICTVLEIRNNRDALSGLDDDEKGVGTVDTPGGPQRMSIINEPGLYSLILRSRKPEAKAFKRWITHEVLPTIRKTGRYEVATSEPLDDLDVAENMIRQIRAQRQRLAAVEAQQQEISARMDGIEGKHDWFSALAYARINGLSTERGYLQRLGTAAGRISRRTGFEPAKTRHALYGSVNTYPIAALDSAAEALGSS